MGDAVVPRRSQVQWCRKVIERVRRIMLGRAGDTASMATWTPKSRNTVPRLTTMAGTMAGARCRVHIHVDGSLGFWRIQHWWRALFAQWASGWHGTSNRGWRGCRLSRSGKPSTSSTMVVVGIRGDKNLANDRGAELGREVLATVFEAVVVPSRPNGSRMNSIANIPT
jgi:hypothetical protein